MNFEWTDERVETMRGMFADGLTASEMAAQFGRGLSRNAVIGKLHRMGMRRGAALKKPRVPKHEAVGAPAGSLAYKVIHSIKRKQQQAETGIEPQPFVCRDASDIVPRHLDLLELESGDCKYPYGDGPIYTFCGHPRRKDTPYCPGHCAVAFNGVPPRRSQRQENIESKPYRMGGGRAA